MASAESRSIFDKSNPDGIYPQLAKLEATLELPAGFSDALVKEDDWSFIIKLHALLETALTSLLVTAVGDTRLHDAFSRLEMSRSQTGKVDFARALELLDRPERRFIRTLSELRNRLIHRIENVTFDLRQYVKSLDPNKKAAFLESVAPWYGEERDENYESFKKYAAANPKVLIWLNGLMFVATMMVHVESLRYKRENEQMLVADARAQIQQLRESTTTLQRLIEHTPSSEPASETE